MKKNILILGGTGFIGSFLVDAFSKDNNYNITILSQSKIKQQNKINCRYIQMEYTKDNFMIHLKKSNYDAIHFLSGNPYPFYSQKEPLVDLKLTIAPVLAMLETLQTIEFKGTLWVASSVAVYGQCQDEYLSEKSKCLPISNYAVAKITVENYVRLYSELYGIQGGLYRIFSTYGPGLERQVIYDNIMKIRANPESIILLSSPDSARDLSYVEDQAYAIKFLSDNVVPSGDIYNIGSGKSYKILDVIKTIAELLNYRGEIIADKNVRNFDGISWTADIKKIESLGYKQVFSLKDGIRSTIETFFK